MTTLADTIFDVIVQPIKYSTKRFGKNRGVKTPWLWGYWIYVNDAQVGIYTAQYLYSFEEAIASAKEHCLEIAGRMVPINIATRTVIHPSASWTIKELLSA